VAAWQLHDFISPTLTFEKVVRGTNGQIYDVLYIASHGTLDSINMGGDEYVSIAAFSSFAAIKKIRLVVLGVCEGSWAAEMLLAKGVEAVVFWLSEVDDDHAKIFARIFFASLSDGNSLQGAIENVKFLLPDSVSPNLIIKGYRFLSFTRNRNRKND
jgi:hypothetical protein